MCRFHVHNQRIFQHGLRKDCSSVDYTTQGAVQYMLIKGLRTPYKFTLRPSIPGELLRINSSCTTHSHDTQQYAKRCRASSNNLSADGNATHSTIATQEHDSKSKKQDSQPTDKRQRTPTDSSQHTTRARSVARPRPSIFQPTDSTRPSSISRWTTTAAESSTARAHRQTDMSLTACDRILLVNMLQSQARRKATVVAPTHKLPIPLDHIALTRREGPDPIHRLLCISCERKASRESLHSS